MPKSPRRVAYVVTTTGVGGAELQVHDVASSFRARGWDVGIVSLIWLREPFLSLRAEGVQLVSLGMTKGVPDPRALARLTRVLRRWRPDVVHSHMVHANLLARLCRPLTPVPRLISTMHNQDEGPQRRYYAYRLTDRFCDLTTGVSRVAVDEAIRRHAVPEHKIRLVPNGIRVADFAPDPVIRERTRRDLGVGDRFVWLSVGRLTDAKRHVDLLAAVRLVRQRSPDVRVLIAGQGTLHESLQEEIDATDLSSSVSLLGMRDDVPALMQAADGFVLSSAWEGLPLVMLEASASALPIVATDVGGSHDVVAEAETGFLAPALQPDRLAEGMLQVMGLTPQERAVMGERGRQRTAEYFDLDHVVDEWEALYGPT